MSLDSLSVDIRPIFTNKPLDALSTSASRAYPFTEGTVAQKHKNWPGTKRGPPRPTGSCGPKCLRVGRAAPLTGLAPSPFAVPSSADFHGAKSPSHRNALGIEKVYFAALEPGDPGHPVEAPPRRRSGCGCGRRSKWSNTRSASTSTTRRSTTAGTTVSGASL